MQARTIGFLCVVVALSWGDDALAQYSVPSQASRTADDTVELAYGDSERSVARPDAERAIPWEIGASLNFFTSEESLGGEKLAFTDVMLLRLHGLVSIGGIELFLGNDILPKQPSYTDELVWQGSMVGLRTRFGKSWAAWARAEAGPQLDQQGYWFSGEGAVQYAFALQKVLFFESALGLSHTQLMFDVDVQEPFFVDEVFTKVGLALRDPKRGQFAMWVNFDYFYPVLGGPAPDSPDPLTMMSLDPQPRVNMHMGALGAITDNVDLFIEYSIMDRGDLEDGPTTLPILNAGFDQRQIIFGFMRHFGDD